MQDQQLLDVTKNVLAHMPSDWVSLTTHRLDIYDESQAKTEFLKELNKLIDARSLTQEALNNLPTAYDYIRLGHPLSSVMEWVIAELHDVNAKQVISFSSRTMPILAVLRKNHLANKKTRILHTGDLPSVFDPIAVKRVYGYAFEVVEVVDPGAAPAFDGTTVFVSKAKDICRFEMIPQVDFYVNIDDHLGSIILAKDPSYVSEIQHVRRRESIAMTPANCVIALNRMVGKAATEPAIAHLSSNMESVIKTIEQITGTESGALVASSGLSMQYAIVMGLIHNALDEHPGKDIRLLVPPNCYGGTNDQARRVANALPNVEVLDLPVDRDHDMVQSVDTALEQVAKEDAVPLIIVEIPTNPRVEVPDLEKLRDALQKPRKTSHGEPAVEPVFILDQTFCPNTLFLGEGHILCSVKALSYVSGSKFPSGGKCTAGYCVANRKAASLMDKIGLHLSVCDNEATPLQYAILAEQMPSMNQRIANAYKNARAFVSFIKETLPEAKINFVSDALAERGFTPSVFSLDLPTKGATEEEREQYKRELNLKLINAMIGEIPDESKYCVSYGQLKGCYWTIPATSTQGTTKEGDKDYIARVSVSGDMDLEKHKAVFAEFVKAM